jgi:hypothetical protein
MISSGRRAWRADARGRGSPFLRHLHPPRRPRARARRCFWPPTPHPTANGTCSEPSRAAGGLWWALRRGRHRQEPSNGVRARCAGARGTGARTGGLGVSCRSTGVTFPSRGRVARGPRRLHSTRGSRPSPLRGESTPRKGEHLPSRGENRPPWSGERSAGRGACARVRAAQAPGRGSCRRARKRKRPPSVSGAAWGVGGWRWAGPRWPGRVRGVGTRRLRLSTRRPRLGLHRVRPGPRRPRLSTRPRSAAGSRGGRRS